MSGPRLEEAILGVLRSHPDGLSAWVLDRQLRGVVGLVDWWELRGTLGELEREGVIVARERWQGRRRQRRWKVWRLAELATRPAPVLVDPFAVGMGE